MLLENAVTHEHRDVYFLYQSWLWRNTFLLFELSEMHLSFYMDYMTVRIHIVN